MGEVIKQKRHSHLFEYGSVFDFKERVSADSEMSAFLVFANSLYARGDGEAAFTDRTIRLSQLYPIYAEEMDTISRIGVEVLFFQRGIDFYDTRRERVLK